MFKKPLSLIMALLMTLSAFAASPLNAFAEDDLPTSTGSARVDTSVMMPGVPSDSVGLNNYRGNYPEHPVYSYIIQENNSSFTRVQCVSDYFSEKVSEIVVENYSLDGKTLNSSRNIPFELTLFGGFYSGSKYNFFVFGDNNYNESNSKEVFRIVKYSKDWKRLAAVSVYGANTYEPFHDGSLRMSESGGYLYIHTCHTMYAIAGVHHQANVTLVINENDNSVVSSVTGVEWYDTGYVSHSFNQFIETDGDSVYRVNQSDGSPGRGIIMAKNRISSGVRDSAYTIAVDYGKTGKSGDNWTGFELGGFELSDKNCLIAGKTVNYQNYDTAPNNTKNIFICVTDKNLSKSTVKTLTNYTDSAWFVSNPQLIKLSDSRFVVFWEEKYPDTQVYNDIKVRRAKYTILDGSGNQITPIYTYDGDEYYLSDCKPILCTDGVIRWFGGTNFHNEFGGTFLYLLDPDKPEDYGFESGSTKAATVSGKISGCLNNDKTITAELIKNGSAAYKAEVKGNKADYSIKNVAPGTYTLRISKQGHVTHDYKITVKDKDVIQNVKLCPKGDVNGDGETDIMDCSLAQRYIRELTPLDNYQIRCGDVSGTGDGELDIQDVSRILRHIRELAMLY